MSLTQREVNVKFKEMCLNKGEVNLKKKNVTR